MGMGGYEFSTSRAQSSLYHSKQEYTVMKRNYLDLSTAHLSDADYKLLMQASNEPRVTLPVRV